MQPNQADTGLIVDFQLAFGNRLAQICFQHAAGPDVFVHGGLKETPRAPAGGFGLIHRQIRVFQDLIKIVAMLRRQGDSYAGIGSNLVTLAIIGCANGVIDTGNEVHRLGRVLYQGLDDCEFIASQARDEIAVPHALTQTRGHRFQQFIADHVSE